MLEVETAAALVAWVRCVSEAGESGVAIAEAAALELG